MARHPNSYEHAALAEIAAFRQTPTGASPLPPLPDAVREEAKPLGALGRATAWGIGVLQALVIKTIRPNATVRAFRRAGYKGVSDTDDLLLLSLHEVDRVAMRVGKNYMMAGAALGAGAGALGAAGVAADVPLVTALALRAVGDYAVHYGFDPRSPEEQAFARAVLASASMSRFVPTRWMLGKLGTYARPMLPAQAQKLLTAGAAAESTTAGVAMKTLTRRSPGFARTVRRAFPFVGAVAGAVVNAIFLGRVAQTAFMLYRERFLAARYGNEAMSFGGEMAVAAE